MTTTKYIISGLLIIIALFVYQVYIRGYFTLFNTGQVSRIDSDEAFVLISEKSMTILDVRSSKEYETGHLEKAYLYQDNILDTIDLKKPVLVYCTVGFRSNRLAKKLNSRGFKEIYELRDGLIGWSNKSLPIVDTKGELTESVHVYSRFFKPLLREGIPTY